MHPMVPVISHGTRTLSLARLRRQRQAPRQRLNGVYRKRIAGAVSVPCIARRHLILRASAVFSDRQLSRPGQGAKGVNMVYKFGGSSLADAERMKEVVDIICSFPQFYPCIVLSAMGKTTNLLIECGSAALDTPVHEIKSIPQFKQVCKQHLEVAKKLEVDADVQKSVNDLLDELKQLLTGISMMQELTPRAKDAIVSFGERMSTRIFSGFLKSQGIASVQMDAWNMGFLSTDDFTNADVQLEATLPAVKASLSALDEEIPVVTGFLAKGQKSGAITTLGRGGSDLTATVIGLALNLPEVQVWKDVDGVLTSDPRIVPSAQPLSALTYDEASELAHFGAQVLHPRAMKPAMLSQNAMAVRVKNSYNRMAPGTVIQSERDLSDTLLTTIVVKRGISVVDIVNARMMGQFGFLAQVFEIFKENKISVDVVATSEISVSISLDADRCVGADAEDKAQNLLTQFEGWADASLRSDLSIVSLICNIKRSSGILEVVFRCLREQDINVQMISQGASKTNISLVVENEQADKAVKAIHDRFFPA